MFSFSRLTLHFCLSGWTQDILCNLAFVFSFESAYTVQPFWFYLKYMLSSFITCSLWHLHKCLSHLLVVSCALFLPSSDETQWDLCSQIHWDTFSGAKCCSGWGESAEGMSEGDTVGGLAKLKRGSKWVLSPHGFTYLLYAGQWPLSTGEATTQNLPVAETIRLIPCSRRWPESRHDMIFRIISWS